MVRTQQQCIETRFLNPQFPEQKTAKFLLHLFSAPGWMGGQCISEYANCTFTCLFLNLQFYVDIWLKNTRTQKLDTRYIHTCASCKDDFIVCFYEHHPLALHFENISKFYAPSFGWIFGIALHCIAWQR